MASVEVVLHWVDSGSNSMTTFQALMGVIDNPGDALSIFQSGTNLVGTVSNVSKMLQPIRIVTNGLTATSALVKIIVDWKDPNKRVQSGDVLTLISASGTIAVTLLAWAEIGPGAAAAIGAFALAADLQASFQPYLSSAKIWLGNLLTNTLQLSSPISSASSSLYWGSIGEGLGYNLYSYDEIVSVRGKFVCMTDQQTSGQILRISGTPVPGSFTPVNEAKYKSDYCRYLYDKGGSDEIGYPAYLDYCSTTMFK